MRMDNKEIFLSKGRLIIMYRIFYQMSFDQISFVMGYSPVVLQDYYTCSVAYLYQQKNGTFLKKEAEGCE